MSLLFCRVMLDRRENAQATRRVTYDVSAVMADPGALGHAHIAIQGTISKNGKLRKTAIARRTRRHDSYAISRGIRKQI